MTVTQKRNTVTHEGTGSIKKINRQTSRDGFDIMGEVSQVTGAVSSLPQLLYQAVDLFGLDKDELSERDMETFKANYKTLGALLAMTAQTIDCTMEGLDLISPLTGDDEGEAV